MNWDILGHEWAVNLLQAHIARNELRHAYLFSGPGGVGRRTLALRLAQALNCSQPIQAGIPCRSCRICRQIENMQHADLFVVQAEKEGGTLKVDQVRELQHSLSLHPYEAQYKVALLLRLEEANLSAMNALLKTLEEPAPRVVLLLTADSPENLLPTIVSRCEVMRLRPLSLKQIEAGLRENYDLKDRETRLYAHISGGRPGLAMRLAKDPGLMEERNEWLNELAHLMAWGLVERFESAERISKDKDKLRARLEVWLSFWRDVALRAAGASTDISNLDWEEVIDQAAQEIGLHPAAKMVGHLERSVGLLERNVNIRLVVEVLLLDLPHLSMQAAPA